MPDDIEPRAAVMKFACAMEIVLRENDWKNGWEELKLMHLHGRVGAELRELKAAIHELYQAHDAGNDLVGPLARVKAEICDAANFLMMAFDVAEVDNIDPSWDVDYQDEQGKP